MKTYELKISLDENLKIIVDTKNCGFNSLELLGLLELKKEDIMRQLRGEMQPEYVRKVMID